MEISPARYAWPSSFNSFTLAIINHTDGPMIRSIINIVIIVADHEFRPRSLFIRILWRGYKAIASTVAHTNNDIKGSRMLKHQTNRSDRASSWIAFEINGFGEGSRWMFSSVVFVILEGGSGYILVSDFSNIKIKWNLVERNVWSAISFDRVLKMGWL